MCQEMSERSCAREASLDMAQRKQTCRNERELGTQSKVLERLPLCTPSSSVILNMARQASYRTIRKPLALSRHRRYSAASANRSRTPRPLACGFRRSHRGASRRALIKEPDFKRGKNGNNDTDDDVHMHRRSPCKTKHPGRYQDPHAHD